VHDFSSSFIDRAQHGLVKVTLCCWLHSGLQRNLIASRVSWVLAEYLFFSFDNFRLMTVDASFLSLLLNPAEVPQIDIASHAE
jgi:hypothetical protein